MTTLEYKSALQSLLEQHLAKSLSIGSNVRTASMGAPKETDPKEVQYARLEGRIRTAIDEAENTPSATQRATLDSLQESYIKLE